MSLRSLHLICFGLLACNSSKKGSNSVEYTLGGDPVDLLMVVDNSASMTEETSMLAANIGSLLEPDPECPFEVRIGITTTSADVSAGTTTEVDAGEAGTLVGMVSSSFTDPEAAEEEIKRQILCDVTDWSGIDVPSDPEYQCGTDVAGVVSEEYLECLCSPGTWLDNSGTGTEEPFEASLLTACRAAEIPPDDCFDPNSDFEIADQLTVPDLLQSTTGSALLIVTDEGDNSRRLDQGEADPSPYLELYENFEQFDTVSVIGPNIDAETLDCNTIPVTTWSAERLLTATEQTGGVYRTIAEKVAGGNCAATDFAQHLLDLRARLAETACQ